MAEEEKVLRKKRDETKKCHNICGMTAGGIWGGGKETSERGELYDIREVNENRR